MVIKRVVVICSAVLVGTFTLVLLLSWPRVSARIPPALIALPAPGKGLKPVFRFAAWQPQPAPWRDIPL